MDGNYYQNPGFNNSTNEIPAVDNQNITTNKEVEYNYIENILNKNIGKLVKVYTTYPGAKDNTDKVFSGIIEGVGQGHLVLRDPSNGKWYLILLYYLNYMEFEEAISWY